MSMDIRSSLEGLKSLLGVDPRQRRPHRSSRRAARRPADSALGSDRATFSSAGSEVSQTAGDTGVRMDKVASDSGGAGGGNLQCLRIGGGLEACGFDAGRRQ